MQIRPVAPWRIQDLQTAAKVERRKHEYRGAGGAEEGGVRGGGFPSPLRERSGEGAVPPRQIIFFDFRSKNVDCSAF